MATHTVEEVLRLDAQQAYAAFGGVATAAQEAAFAMRQTAVAALGLSQADVDTAASTRTVAAAEQLRAEVLGLTVTQLRQVQAAQAALDAANDKAADAWFAEGDAITKATGHTKQHGAAVQNLRFQLSDIATSLAGGASPGMVLAQQGPQVAEALAAMDGGIGGLAASVGGLVVPLGLLAVGATAVAAAIMSVVREARLEAEAQAFAATVADSHTAALRANENAHLALLVASGEMPEAFAKESRAAYDARDAVKAYAASQETARAAFAARAESDARYLAYSSIFKVGENADGTGGYGPGQILDALTGAADDLEFTNKAVEGLNKALVDQVAIIKTGREDAQKTALIEEDNKARKDAMTASVRANTQAVRDAAAAERDYQASLKNNASYQYDIGLGTSQEIDFAALNAAKMEADRKRWADMQAGMKGDTAAAFAYDAGLGTSAPTSPSVRGAGLAGAAGIVSGGAENALTAALGKVPVLGGIAASLISITQNTGAFLDGITGLVTGITGNLGNLGADIAGFVTDIFQQILPSLIESIPELIEGLLVDLVAGLIVTLTDPSFWADIARGLWTSLKESFVEIWQNIGQNIVDAIKGLLGGGEGDGSILRDSSGKLFGGIRGNLSGENRTGTSRQVGEGLGDLMSGRATWSLFRRTNGERRIGGGVVLGRVGDIADSLRRGGDGRGLDWGNG